MYYTFIRITLYYVLIQVVLSGGIIRYAEESDVARAILSLFTVCILFDTQTHQPVGAACPRCGALWPARPAVVAVSESRV